MTGSCDDCDHMLTWEKVYDFEGHGGEMISECGLPDDLWTDELDELSRQGRCPFWKPIEADALSKHLSDLFEEMKHERMRMQRDVPVP